MGAASSPTVRAQGSAWWQAAAERIGPVAVVFCAVVVVAAGASGVALLSAPAHTDRYFSWTLRPPEAASLIGGFYLASAAVFAWALTLPWRQVRPLVIAVLGLAVPAVALSLVHDEVFDFGRWQAFAWHALFVTAPLSSAAILVTAPDDPGGGPALRSWSRAALAVLAAALAALAVLVWLDRTRDAVADWSPVGIVRLTGTYLGAWCSFLALLSGWAAARNRWDEARVALAALAAASAGASIAFLRSFGQVQRPLVALSASLGLLVLAVATYAANRPDQRTGR